MREEGLVQPGFKFLDNGSRIMTGTIGIGLLDHNLKRLDRGAKISDPRVDHAGFTPQRHYTRREHQHSLNHTQRVLGPAGAFVTGLNIVL